MAWAVNLTCCFLVACDFRHCISLSLIHQVRSEITGFLDRTFSLGIIMATILIFFFYFLSIITATVCATFLMYHNINGWGWIIAIAISLTFIKLHVKES